MYTLDYLQSLPKVEVSFQDDFPGNEREVTLTPEYILLNLKNMELKVEIGDKVLLFQKDTKNENEEYYLCNTGEVKEVNKEILDRYSIQDTSSLKFVELKNKPVFFEISTYFDLPKNYPIFDK